MIDCEYLPDWHDNGWGDTDGGDQEKEKTINIKTPTCQFCDGWFLLRFVGVSVEKGQVIVTPKCWKCGSEVETSFFLPYEESVLLDQEVPDDLAQD